MMDLMGGQLYLLHETGKKIEKVTKGT